MTNWIAIDWLQMELVGTGMILMIALMRIIFRHRLPRQTFLWLWAIVWIRLCIPVSISVPVSWISFLDHTWNNFVGRKKADQLHPVAHATITNGNSATPMYTEAPMSTALYPHAIPSDSVPTISWPGGLHAMPMTPLSTETLWIIIRIVGAVGCMLYFVIAYVQWYQRFQSSVAVKHDVVQRWRDRHPLRRPLAIRESSHIDSPLTYGVLRPVILLPVTTDYTDEQKLDHILTHEYVHIRRFDSLIKMIMLGTLCWHWYNPFVWLMYALVNRDIELACDAEVVRRAGYAKRGSYARTLIHMEEKKAALPVTVNYFGRLAIEERIEAIMKFKSISAIAILSSTLLIGGTAVMLATPTMAATTHAKVSTSSNKATTPIGYTASINESGTKVPVYGVGQTWKLNNEWAFTVNSIQETSLRGDTADGYRPAKQAFIVTYSYKNLRPAGSEPLAFSKANFDLSDAQNDTFYADGSHNGIVAPNAELAQNAAPGQQINGAGWAYAFYDHTAKTVRLNIGAFDQKDKLHEASFVVAVQPESK